MSLMTAATGYTSVSNCSTTNCNNVALPCGATVFAPVVSFNMTLAGYTSATFQAAQQSQLVAFITRRMAPLQTNWTVTQVLNTGASNVTVTLSTTPPPNEPLNDFMGRYIDGLGTGLNLVNLFVQDSILTLCTAISQTACVINGTAITGSPAASVSPVPSSSAVHPATSLAALMAGAYILGSVW
jgi:hypothetical protein